MIVSSDHFLSFIFFLCYNKTLERVVYLTSSDFLLNDLELSIIKILYKNPHTPFNYEMMWAYLKLTEDFLEIMGAMQSLEKNGFIYPSIENKKYYYLSDDGKRYLQRLKKIKKDKRKQIWGSIIASVVSGVVVFLLTRYLAGS